MGTALTIRRFRTCKVKSSFKNMAEIKKKRDSKDEPTWGMYQSDLKRSPNDMLGMSNGANVVLCSQDGYKMSLPEILVKEGTNLFRRLKTEDIESLRDPFGRFTFILEGVNRSTLWSLNKWLTR